jgi:YVTN family beta-propeller protein
MNYRNGIPYLYMYNLNSELPFDAPSEDDFICHFPDKLPLVAAFSISPLFGKAPLNVTFTDKTTGTPTVWDWNFGDGTNSTHQNPAHIYSKTGTYTVNLTVSNANGTSSKTSEIDVKNASPTGPYAYITNSRDNNVSVIDTVTNVVIATVDVGYSPWGVAVNPAGTKAYVTNSGSDSVSVIDITTNTVTAAVNVESSPLGVAINPAGTKVYVTNGGSGTVSVIDTETNKH